MENKKPNVILILTDDQGYGDIGIHDNEHIETPTLDRLGENSVRFHNFHASPVCAPTRASLLTGRNFLKTGVSHVHGGRDFVNIDEVMLPEVLKDNGYKTAMMGKWHSGKTNAYLPYNRGFDEAWVATLYQHYNCRMDYNGHMVETKGWTTDVLTDLAIDFIDDNSEQPFFLYLPYLGPHEPWEAPDSYVDKYQAKGLSKGLSTIYGMVEQIDQNVGRLFNKLEEKNIMDNTLIIYMSDNGPIGDCSINGSLTQAEMDLRNPPNMRGNKGTIWENGSRVPCFIHYPKKFKPRLITDFASCMDIFPTILDMTNSNMLNESLSIDGLSLIPTLEGDSDVPNRFLFNGTHETWWEGRNEEWEVMPASEKLTFEQQRENISVREGKYKLVKTGLDAYELFDIEEDLQETRDLSLDYPQKTEELKAALKEWYVDLIHSGRSHQIATFYIGYKDEDSTLIPTYAPVHLEGQVKASSHFTYNWTSAGDAQIINVDILADDYYKLSFKGKVIKPNTIINVQIGEQKVEETLRLNEQTELGVVKLPKGKTYLTISLKSTSEGEGEAIQFGYPADGIVIEKVNRN
ncbi:arylsulfatase [Halolactibacillus sp. JCM 19043]|uniref:arylsulfatase n=1 Tax=Halolactibacillus sp. JCM 19043 TaxID=1460638 RepID=UPI000782DB21|nr:arylsulfatase [Halolactibacillus sp. JCM 19043]